MKNLGFIAAILMSTTTLAASVNPINISAANVALNKAIDKQCERPSFVDSQECVKKLRDRYLLEGKFRGTVQYAEAHYKKLSDKALHRLLFQLKQLRKKARDLSDALMDPVEGELTDDKYDAEIQWVIGEMKTRGVSVPRGE